MRVILFFVCFSFSSLLLPLPANAYIGPGIGLGALGVILGLIASILLAIFGVFWYPIKRLLRKLHRKTQGNE